MSWVIVLVPAFVLSFDSIGRRENVQGGCFLFCEIQSWKLRPATDRRNKEERRKLSQLNEGTAVNYLIGARHVMPRLHTAGFGSAFKGKERRAHPKSQSEGREGLWSIIIHATATLASRSLGKG
jgi:hypothetical protein